MLFQTIRLYSKLYGVFKDRMNINIRGLGFLLRKIKHDCIFTIKNRKMFFNHHVGPCYARLISGDWNEPETHKFLEHVMTQINEAAEFIDVGANIGEMVVDMTRYKNVVQITAFEPIPECAYSIEKSIELNEYKSAKVVNKVVSDSEAPVQFQTNSANPHGSGVMVDQSTSYETFYPTTLDKELSLESHNPILLIDAEGFEPYVLRGGIGFIKHNRPLIIFEYNNVSKNSFSIRDIEEIIGEEYHVYRLRQDGKLDSHTEKTWNCVAIHSQSRYWHICESLIVTSISA